jgi:hypothetical protein
MKNARTLATSMLVALGMAAGTVTTADAADTAGAATRTGDAWVGKSVRLQFGAVGTAAVTGKVTRMDRCLYVLLDAPRDGIKLIRLDQARDLQVRGSTGWTPRDVEALVAKEPAHCRAEANG